MSVKGAERAAKQRNEARITLLVLALSMLAMPGTAEWILTRSKDLETGVTMTTYQVASEEKPFAYLVIRTGQQVECFVNGKYGSTVKYRFNRDNTFTYQIWKLSRSGTSLVYPGDCAKFLDRVRESKRLEFEF